MKVFVTSDTHFGHNNIIKYCNRPFKDTEEMDRVLIKNWNETVGKNDNAIGDEYFVNVTAVVITNIDFSDAFEKAVEDKMIAEQNKLKAEYENETKIQKAEADAKAKIVSAEADAKANELLEKSLTDKVLRQKYIDKWDGKLPSTMVGDETSVMIPAN